MTERMWDIRYAALAKHVAEWSRDPRAKVGAVITDKRHRVVALGYNGFPVGVEDSAERLNDKDQKNKMVVHAEENAILIAGAAAEGGTIYIYGKPVCSRCAGVIIQAGIKHVVAEPPQAGTKSHWDAIGQIAKVMFEEAKVKFHPLPVEPETSQSAA
jgi:dCMP deaminase